MEKLKCHFEHLQQRQQSNNRIEMVVSYMENIGYAYGINAALVGLLIPLFHLHSLQNLIVIYQCNQPL